MPKNNFTGLPAFINGGEPIFFGPTIEDVRASAFLSRRSAMDI